MVDEYVKVLESNPEINFVVFTESGYKYVAVEDSTRDDVVIVHQFRKSDGSLEDIYLADKCTNLEEFIEAD